MRTFFRWAAQSRLIDYDPTLPVSRAKVGRRLPRRLPHHVVADLVDAADGELQRALLLTFLHTGCRLSEVAGMRTERWDRCRQEITVIGKGDKERSIPLSDELVGAWERWERVEVLTRPGPMWPSMRRPEVGITPRSVANHLERIARVAGHQIRPHDLRHTCASNLVENGVDIAVVRQLLGHESLTSTSIYVDALGAQIRTALKGQRYLG